MSHLDTFKKLLPDADPLETQDWIDALESLLLHSGPERARFVLRRLLKKARLLNLGMPHLIQTPYINTISPEQEPPFPGDEAMEKRIRRMVRWNAAAMVTRGNTRYPGLGGHLSTYASAASLYEVGFNHFFRGRFAAGGSSAGGAGDHVYFQGHAAPGIYARAFLEGRLTEENLDHFRRETRRGVGLSSYPHPRLMPEFWQFPTVSMGLGPIAAIYQARFNRYLQARGIADTRDSRVWCFPGDGEMDEPEALGGLAFAGREGLDNLIFVVNCNLQRLDGPVRGNGKIIQELEGLFRGAGWNVIKVIWGREWDELLSHDFEGLLLKRMNETVDGWFQRYTVEPGAFTRRHFFGSDPRLLELVAHLSDDDIRRLRRGGHDYRKLYAAYKAAVEHRGQPTAILAHTVKGWTLGEGFEAKNVTHQMKKMSRDELRAFRDRLELPIADKDLEHEPPYYHPGPQSTEIQYMLERRRELGGPLPSRVVKRRSLAVPGIEPYQEFLAGTEQEVSSTMAFVRLFARLLREKEIGPRLVPIIPDEARTFGMDALFSSAGIYSSAGQVYEPVDHATLMKYKESTKGQILEEGITEAGSLASFIAAGTAYATHGEPMIPFYMFYSMFGLQRTGDQVWAFGDIRGQGFLLGCTAGRTTLNGEGLQHQDGQSLLLASAIPNIRAYDPCFAFEMAIIIRDGLRRMYERHEDLFYYITLYNENYPMPPMPEGVEEDLLRGLYLFRSAIKGSHKVRLLGSGPILREALRAQEILADRYDVAADVYSATSYKELRRDALAAERESRLHPDREPRVPFVTSMLQKGGGPVIAASDFVRMVPDQIARWVPADFTSLGTDGYGMSDTRAALRRHFEVDAEMIALTALERLAAAGRIERQTVARAIGELGINAGKVDPVTV
ncbi:MAG: pyruvate dehydrogenase (acetyl-transferring), homodimeric type [Planctomycetota bacterium]